MDSVTQLLAALLGGNGEYSPKRPSRYGPLGVEFVDDDSPSPKTEWSLTLTDPRLNRGRATNVPSLVPGQVDIQNLLQERPITKQQVLKAILWALSSGHDFPSFESISEAETAAKKRSANKSER